MLVKIRKKEDGPSAIFSASAERGPLGLTVVINAYERDFEIESQGATWLFPEHFQDEHFAMLFTSQGQTAEVILVAENPEDAEELRLPRFDQREKDQLVIAFIKDGLLARGLQLGHCFGDTADHAPEPPEGFTSVIKKAKPDSVAEVMISTFGQALMEADDDQFGMECHHPEYGTFEIIVRRKNTEEKPQNSIAKPHF